jgi:hypothetical protein
VSGAVGQFGQLTHCLYHQFSLEVHRINAMGEKGDF